MLFRKNAVRITFVVILRKLQFVKEAHLLTY